MSKKMLIDATHAEETRVAVVEGNRLVDYDYESQLRKQLKGSIFLAKVTRVEPSLQAAFVNFGGNRHGFLPFSEIHPDYFRIPIADREALIAAQQAEIEALRAQEEAEDKEDLEREASEQPSGETEDESSEMAEEEDVEEIGGEDAVAREDEENQNPEGDSSDSAEETDEDDGESDNGDDQPIADFTNRDDVGMEEAQVGNIREPETEMSDSEMDGEQPEPGNEREQEPNEARDADGNNDRQRNDRGGRGGRYRGRGGRHKGGGRGGSMHARSRRFEKHGDDEGDGPRMPGRRQYKIQEVVKRGQIMLVQASREERGNKGAAVTTYLSLPGRYCVLMPNSHRAGGVSRKVASFQERRRMREILAELKVPEGMSVIMRTAGVSRTKPEIKRDLDYLLKLWDSIRELTLQSTAPALVHEEGQLIRRAIRDIYGPDIEDIEVSGEDGYKLAKDYMKMMIPSHVKHVHHYADEKIPLFHRYQVENQISSMSEPSVTLRSGGYIVINPTEALVSIDVNSGRATRERHIEETALKTNLEAAEEVARQLRLRDLGGLIVIDFIDMEDRRNNRKVENRLRDALASDRARIQIGRISSFGLLELSRQRLNPSLTEAQFERCAHCKGVGYVRTVDMTAITAMRALEDEGIKARAAEVALHVPDSVALYILNNKREIIADIERRYGFRVMIKNDESLAPAGFRVEPLRTADGQPVVISEEEKNGELQQGHHGHRHHHEGGGSSEGGRGGGRRRGRRGGRGRDRGRFGEDRPDNNGGGEDMAAAPEGDENASPDDRHSHEPDSFGNAGAAEETGDDNRGNRGGHDRPPYREGGGREGANREGGDREGGRPHGGGRRRGRRGGRGRNRYRDRDGNRDPSSQGHEGPRQHDRPHHNRPPRDERPRHDDDSRGNERPQHSPRERQSHEEPHRERVEHAPPPARQERAAPPSNDAAPPPPRDYEKVNEPPASKKKGWWNRLTE